MANQRPFGMRLVRQKRFKAEYSPRKHGKIRSARGRSTWRNEVRFRDRRRQDRDEINFGSIEWVLRTLGDTEIRPQGVSRGRELAIDLTEDRRRQLALEDGCVFDTLIVRLSFNARGTRARITGATFAWKGMDQLVRQPLEQEPRTDDAIAA